MLPHSRYVSHYSHRPRSSFTRGQRPQESAKIPRNHDHCMRDRNSRPDSMVNRRPGLWSKPHCGFSSVIHPRADNVALSIHVAVFSLFLFLPSSTLDYSAPRESWSIEWGSFSRGGAFCELLCLRTNANRFLSNKKSCILNPRYFIINSKYFTPARANLTLKSLISTL